MCALNISLFGECRIAHRLTRGEPDDVSSGGEAREAIKLTRVTQSLLAYLILNRQHLHPRDVLISLFWGELDEARARSCLSTALWRLRRALEPGGVTPNTFLLATPQGEVGFNRDSDFWLDIEMFEKQAASALAKPVHDLEELDAEHLKEALALYTRDLLEGHYEDWALRERERLRRIYLNSLAHLMRFYKRRKNLEAAVDYGNRILELDPLREEIHREMMRLYALNGQRTQVVQQYQRCRALLQRELSIEPMDETRQLHAELTSSGNNLSSPARPVPPSPDDLSGVTLQQAQQELHRALVILTEARAQLQQAIALVEAVRPR
jgi:DNA-binding SARP family transcriptional activator